MVRLSWRYGAELRSREWSAEEAADGHAVGGAEPTDGALVALVPGDRAENRAKRMLVRPVSAGSAANRARPPPRAGAWTPRPGARPACRSEKKTISESVCRRSCATNALSTRSADDHDAERPAAPGTRAPARRPPDTARHPASPGSSQRPWVICPSSARPISAPREKSSLEEVPVRGPGLEHAGPVGDEHPVGAGLEPQLVGLVEQVGAIAAAERLADARDVGRHLHQRLGEAQQRGAPAFERFVDGGRRSRRGRGRRRRPPRRRPAAWSPAAPSRAPRRRPARCRGRSGCRAGRSSPSDGGPQ